MTKANERYHNVLDRIDSLLIRVEILEREVKRLKDRKEKENAHYFSESKYYDKTVFLQAWDEKDYYKPLDGEFYYEALLSWSHGDKKGKKPKRSNWLSVARGFAQRDKTPKIKTGFSQDSAELGNLFRK